ncbi:MAG TPA: DoxX family protein [Planctomycetes bacterium]|nr:DoxX family protein [Fuerstiella sp.]HIK95581.1 DoxX family protein [Planctomycetota bacterium]
MMNPFDMLPALFAHVSYVVDPEKLRALSGRDWPFLFSPLSDPLYVTLIVVTIVVTVAVIAGCQLLPGPQTFCRSIHDRLLTYSSFVPMILRTALGVALIVAGTKSAIFLPYVPGDAVGTLEVVLGFCVLVGFMVRPCGLVALGVYFYGLSTSQYLLGTLESAAAALLIAAHGPDRPSTDDVLNVDVLGAGLEPLWKQLRDNSGVVLRLAMGCTMIWLAVTEKAFNPRVSEAVVIDFELESVVPVSTAMWVFSVGVIELAVGLVLVLGFFTRTFSFIAFVVLTLSFFYFKEEVAGHVTFFGTLMILMITGAGRASLDALIARKTRGVVGTACPYGMES